MKRKNVTEALHAALAESRARGLRPATPARPKTLGDECSIGQTVDFEFDGAKLTGVVTTFGPYGLVRIATDPSRPLFLHSVGGGMIRKIH